MDNTKYWENRVNRLIRARLAQIDRIFKEAAEEAARLGVSLNVNTDKPFRFSDYPATKQRIDNLMKEVHDNLQSVVVNGVDGAWKIANDKEDEFCKAVFSGRTLTKEQKQRYFNHSDKAREAFALRKTAGLNLSDRVWRYTEQFKQEIEMGLDLGIGEGRSAADMARDLKRYLREPDKLFRRVRDKRGNLQLSKNAAAYHPGAGVYRSSYKNALRLTRTETNMAYRTADQMRYQSLDFVVGIEIHTSNNHPVTDICDELKGKYPKDFKFVGWHPQCRCYVTSILKTEKEIEEDTENILAGKKVSGESVNRVDDVPQGFKDWVDDNRERIEAAEERGTLPYFLKDNQAIVKPIMDNLEPSSEEDVKKYFHTFYHDPDDSIYKENPIYKFDPIAFDKDLSAVLAKYGGTIKDRDLEIFSRRNNKVEMSYSFMPIGKMTREFIVRNGVNIVDHTFLQIEDAYQHNGLSRDLMRILYKGYKRAGIDMIELQANLDVGGYTWARYGFTYAEGKQYLLNMINYQANIYKRDFKEAVDIVEAWYKENASMDAFPMNLLTGYSWSKDLLLNTFWKATLNLHDMVQMDVFERYLGIK